MMKPEALFINNGRGPTVDEAALIKALEEGWIAGAGLDVTEIEPPDPDNACVIRGWPAIMTTGTPVRVPAPIAVKYRSECSGAP